MKTHSKLIEFENEIIELSASMSHVDIAKQFNTNQSEISKLLRLHGIKHKKSRLNMSRIALNIDYFKEIDSIDKAYWLGFICADGNIKKSNNKITLTSKDLEIIEGFRRAIGSEHTISKNIKFDKRTNKTYTGYTIQITNEIFTKHLVNLGITSEKTDILEFPKIKNQYYSYFIAGLFDGDGSVSWAGKNKNHIKISLITTKEILSFINDNILQELNVKPKYSCKVTKNKSNVWKMYLYSDAHNFLDFIYSDNNFNYLKRKHDMYIENIKNRKFVRHLKKIHQLDLNMNIIKIWSTQQEVADYLQCPTTTLNSYLNKYKNKTYKNSYWRYEN